MGSKQLFLCAAALVALSSAARADPTPAAQADVAQPAKPAAKPAPAKSDTKSDVPAQNVVVTATPQEVRTSIDRKSYSLGKDIQATSGAIGDALRNIPSVQMDVQGNLSLRGDSNVTILVDGQPSPLFSGPNRADALQQLPANQFDRVEVITNPSAAFKPDGSAGIINLVTKKGASSGGMIGSLRANIGTDDRYNASANLSYGNKVYSLSGGLGLSQNHNRYDQQSTGQQVDPISGQVVNTKSGGEGKSNSTSISLYGSGSYNLDKQNRLTGSANLFSADVKSSYNGFYRTDVTTGALAQNYTQTNQGPGRFTGDGVSGGYVHKFAGEEHELSVNLNYHSFNNRFNSSSTLDYVTPAQPPLFQGIGQVSSTGDTDLKIEYKSPMPAQAKLVAGYEVDAQHQSNDHPVSLGTSAANAVPSALLSNLFKFDQTVHALYLTYQQPFGALTVLPGLRLEEAIIDTDQVTTKQSDSDSYFTAYPTLHLDYQLAPGQSLKASYSRRVNRPSGQILNPFRLYNGPLAYSQGNPRLQPQTTDSYEAGYEFRDKTGTYYSATLYYRDNRKTFTSVTQDLGRGVLLTTNENLGESRNAGLELVANGKLLKTLSYNVSGNVYWNEINAANLGFANTRSTVTEYGRINLNWEPTTKDFLQVNVYAGAKQLTPQGYRGGTTSVNLGYRHKFDDRISGVVTVQDLFDGNHIHTVIDTAILKSDSETNFHARGLFLGLVYALGNPNAKRPDTFDYNSGAGAGGGAPTP